MRRVPASSSTLKRQAPPGDNTERHLLGLDLSGLARQQQCMVITGDVFSRPPVISTRQGCDGEMCLGRSRHVTETTKTYLDRIETDAFGAIYVPHGRMNHCN